MTFKAFFKLNCFNKIINEIDFLLSERKAFIGLPVRKNNICLSPRDLKTIEKTVSGKIS